MLDLFFCIISTKPHTTAVTRLLAESALKLEHREPVKTHIAQVPTTNSELLANEVAAEKRNLLHPAHACLRCFAESIPACRNAECPQQQRLFMYDVCSRISTVGSSEAYLGFAQLGDPGSTYRCDMCSLRPIYRLLCVSKQIGSETIAGSVQQRQRGSKVTTAHHASLTTETTSAAFRNQPEADSTQALTHFSCRQRYSQGARFPRSFNPSE